MESAQKIALGRWHGILPALGIDSRFLKNQHGPCPICGGVDRFRYDNERGRGTYFCSSCGPGDGYTLLQRVKGWSFAEAAKRVKEMINYVEPMAISEKKPDAINFETMKKLWNGCVPISPDNSAGIYLKSRLTKFIKPLNCGHKEGIIHPTDNQKYSALVAKIVSVESKTINLHLTYLTPSGEKAPVKPQKRVMAGKLPDGCAIRLFKEEPVLGIAEGIETALAASIIYGIPVWAAINCTMLTKWVPPEGVEQVVVFGDNDRSYAGQASAYILAQKLIARHHVKADVVIPDRSGSDWADLIASKDLVLP